MALGIGLSLGLLAMGCSEDTAGGTASPGDECESSAECQGDLECIDDICADPESSNQEPNNGDPNNDTPNNNDSNNDDPGTDCPDPTSCDDVDAQCGWIGDGCGNAIYCGDCSSGQACGSGDDANTCIDTVCEPIADPCGDLGAQCGSLPDGCGGTVNCGECSDDQACHTNADGAGICSSDDCQPLTCADHSPGDCGVYPDGCGDFVDCGGCGSGETCDAGECIVPDCTPLTCNDYTPGECGPHPDGCGGFIDCGLCDGDEVCGTGDDFGQCVESDCEPLTCDDYDTINCGAVADGCGGMTQNCGSCVAPEICGGSGVPNVCGADSTGGIGCDNLCQDQAICSAGEATTLTGTAFAPNETLPLANATVYVPNVPLDDLPDITTGPICEQCEDEDLGDPLVGTITDYDGTFELRHVPANVEFPLVIKIGQWRRVVMVPPQDPCGETALSSDMTSLPSQHGVDNTHDHLPKTAITTGSVDAMECVFRKLGVDDSEFGRHTDAGHRFHIYRANGGVADAGLASGCTSWTNCWSNACTDRDNNCPTNALEDNLSSQLYTDSDKLNDYDMVVMGCEANDYSTSRSTADKNRIRDYVNGGGRLFASHYAYDWLHQTDQLQDTATWGGGEDFNTTGYAFIDTSFPGGGTFWDWLQLVDADNAPLGPNGEPQIEIADPRTYVQSVNESLANRWVYTQSWATNHNNRNSVQQYTFDTPVYASDDDQCGRVAYSAFHVAGANTAGGPAFPGYCDTGPLTPQEKVLAYMLFDLGACVTADGEPPEPVCTPQTCADAGAQCGQISDGCGETINCGSCPDGQACGAGGAPNQCGGDCTPMTCGDHDAECGIVSDGCGSTVDCGTCPDGQACGGGGEANQCGCTPMTCDDHGAECGQVSDGCGSTLNCGECPDGQECGGEGVPNQCGGDCNALTCDDHGAECGSVADGCGNTLDCGSCPDPQTCGAGGQSNQCDCIPLTCDDHNAECGEASDGCGNTLDCGTCPDDLECNEFLQCTEPVCGNPGDPCQQNSDCCTNACAIDSSDDQGVCIPQ